MYRRHRGQDRHGEHGQAIVEAAFVIPLIIVLLCGILDFGWIYSNQLMINNCSREGARYAAAHSQSTTLTQDVKDRIAVYVGIGSPQELTVEVTKTEDGDVRVQVIKTVPVLTPLVGVFVENQQMQLNSTTVMKIG